MDTLRYFEQRPGPLLADAVRCIWMVQGHAVQGAAPDPVIPDGCVELVFNLADPFEQRISNGFIRQPMAMLVGQSTRPVVIRATGRVDLVGIRLQPWAARRLLRLPASELRDLLLPLSDVPTVERLDAFALPDMLASAETPKRRLAVLSRVLQPALESNAARNTGAGRESVPRNRVKQVVQLVVEGGSPTTIREIAAHTGYSMRAIQRMFDDDVGLAPKTLMRIARVQRALRIARESPHLPWASIGARAGYFDQSHLVRDFRELVGCAPSQFRAPGDSLTHALLERPAADEEGAGEG